MTESSSKINSDVPGVLKSIAKGGWKATAYSNDEVSDGVHFKCSHSHIMPGLQKSASTTSQSYPSLDYGFCCRPTGKFEVFEKGARKYTDTQVYDALKSDLEIRIVNKQVQYVVDGRVAYISKTPILDSETVHFASCFHSHPSELRDIMTDSSKSGIIFHKLQT